MQIKKFKAESFAIAMDKVKKELGDHALILKTKTFEENFLPDLERKAHGGVEITAAVDHRDEESGIAVAKLPENKLVSDKTQDSFYDDQEVRTILYTLLSQTDLARARGLKDHQLSIYKDLLNSGIEERLVSRMFGLLNESKSVDGLGNAVSDKKFIRNFMNHALLCSGPINMTKGYPRIVVLVGPTGVGKTTTIAKLAAHYAINKQKKVAMISLDNYRVGAVDQLRVYGEIMQVSVEAAGDAKQFRKAVNKHSEKDVIFVDTTGKTHRDKSYAGLLKESLHSVGPVEIHLVLSASLHEKVWIEAYHQFAQLHIDRTLVTKLDEGMTFGTLFNHSIQTRTPYSYFTNGQRVPEDIEVADAERVIRLIFNLNQAKLGD